MAMAAAHQLAASSATAKLAYTVMAAIPRAALPGSCFAPLSAHGSPISGSSWISVRSSNRDGSTSAQMLHIRAAAPEKSSEQFKKQAEEVFNDLKAKWSGLGNKPSLALYGSAVLAALWFSSTVVNTINYVPLLPNFMELIGLGYSAWFVYRYLLFQDNRKELAAEIKELKRRITGAADDISS